MKRPTPDQVPLEPDVCVVCFNGEVGYDTDIDAINCPACLTEYHDVIGKDGVARLVPRR